MPAFDIAFVLDNPRFRDDTLVRRRSTKTVSNRGRTVATAVPDVTFSGVVVPAESADIIRGPDAERVEGQIVVHTRLDLQIDDIVAWHGNDYRVEKVDDWTNRGFCSATCT